MTQKQNWSEEFDEKFPKSYKYGDSGLMFETDIGKLYFEIKSFIQNTLNRERERWVELVENKRKLARFGNNDELNNSYEMALEDIITTLKEQ